MHETVTTIKKKKNQHVYLKLSGVCYPKEVSL